MTPTESAGWRPDTIEEDRDDEDVSPLLWLILASQVWKPSNLFVDNIWKWWTRLFEMAI